MASTLRPAGVVVLSKSYMPHLSRTSLHWLVEKEENDLKENHCICTPNVIRLLSSVYVCAIVSVCVVKNGTKTSRGGYYSGEVCSASSQFPRHRLT
jgi:hypothetical protein